MANLCDILKSHHNKVSYGELITLHENLKLELEQTPESKNRSLLEALLMGANELLLRQDESNMDFTVAIIILLKIASDELSSAHGE